MTNQEKNKVNQDSPGGTEPVSSEAKSGPTKICKYCQSEIPAKAKVCPVCRKKLKHTGRNIALIVIGVLVVIMMASCLGGSSTSTKTDYTVGETAEQNDIQITLDQVTQNSGDGMFAVPSDGNVFVNAEFTIVNNSNNEINVSSIVGFDAYVDSVTVNQSITGLTLQTQNGKSQLDGTVGAGKKMIGVITYEIPSNWSEFEINVAPSFWSSDKFKFIIKPDQVTQE